MRELANRRMLAAVPGADLVVMNPTQFAVALTYDEATMGAPRVVAKGADLLAFKIRDAAQAWLHDYQRLAERHAAQHHAPAMLRTNPKYVLRNHVGELAIQAARAGDFSLVQKLLPVLAQPFDEHPSMEEFAGFPPEWAASIAISCSS